MYSDDDADDDHERRAPDLADRAGGGCDGRGRWCLSHRPDLTTTGARGQINPPRGFPDI